METPIGTIYSTTAIKAFQSLTGLTPEQFLLGINDVSVGDGAKITLANLISSMISSDEGNLLSVGTDDLLKAESSSVSFDDLSDTEKVIFGETNYGNTTSVDLDAITKNGFYTCLTTATGVPSASYDWFVVHQNSSEDTTSATQRAVAVNSTPLTYERTKVSSVWGSWVAGGVAANPDLSNLSSIGYSKFEPRTPFSVNSAKTNASGYADFITKVSDTSVTVLATDVDLVQTDVLGRTHTTTADYTITGISADGTYEVIQEFGMDGVAQNPIATTKLIAEVQALPAVSSALNGNYYTLTSIQPMKQYKVVDGAYVETTFNKLGGFVRTAGTMGTPVSYALNGYYNSGRFAISSQNSYLKNHLIGVSPDFLQVQWKGSATSGGALRDFLNYYSNPYYYGGIVGSLTSKTVNAIALAGPVITNDSQSTVIAVEGCLIVRRSF